MKNKLNQRYLVVYKTENNYHKQHELDGKEQKKVNRSKHQGKSEKLKIWNEQKPSLK